MITILATKTTIKAVNGAVLSDVTYFETPTLHNINFEVTTEDLLFSAPTYSNIKTGFIAEDLFINSMVIDRVSAALTTEDLTASTMVIDRVSAALTTEDLLISTPLFDAVHGKANSNDSNVSGFTINPVNAKLVTNDSGVSAYDYINPLAVPQIHTVFSQKGNQWFNEPGDGTMVMAGNNPSASGHPNSNNIIGAMSNVFSGDFSCSFRVITAIVKNLGFCGVTILSSDGNTNLISGTQRYLLETCGYAAWPSALRRRGYPTYSYASYANPNTTYTLTRTGSNATLEMYNGATLIVSTSISTSVDLRVLIYYCRDAAGDSVNTISLDSFVGF